MGVKLIEGSLRKEPNMIKPIKQAAVYLDLIKTVVLVRSPQGKVRFANQWLCQILGLTKSEIIGKNWFYHFIPKQDRIKSKSQYKKFTTGLLGTEQKIQQYLQTAAHDLLLINWNDSLLSDKHGKTIGVFSSGDDITENFLLRHYLSKQKIRNSRALKEAILQNTEKQRTDIASELHDGVNQLLTVSKLLIEQVQQEHKIPQLGKIADYTQQVIDKLRYLSHELHPSSLSVTGIDVALEDLLYSIRSSGHLQTNFKVSGIEQLKQLQPSIALSLYRIVQESLVNTIKHARASEVFIELNGSSDSIDLEISDNGKGFSTTENRPGFGLKNIYMRAESLGGIAYISSYPGNGTLISIHIPFTNPQKK
jgi:PAS domain S-box-containing protein